MTQQPYSPEQEPYSPQDAPPEKKRRPLLWILLAVAAIVVIAIVASAGGRDDPSGSASSGTTSPAATGGGDPTEGAEEPTDAARPPADDPLSDGGWTVSDIQLESSPAGAQVTARVTNNEGGTRTGVFTLTIFDPDDTRVAVVTGSASDVEGGQTATVTFIGTQQFTPDPAIEYRYEFQTDL